MIFTSWLLYQLNYELITQLNNWTNCNHTDKKKTKTMQEK